MSVNDRDPSMWSVYWPVDESKQGSTAFGRLVRRYVGVTTNMGDAKSVDQDAGKRTFWHLRMDPWVMAVILAMACILIWFSVGGVMESERSMALVLAYAALSMIISDTDFTCLGLMMSMGR